MDINEERSVCLAATKNIDAVPRPAAIYQIEQLASLGANPFAAFNPIRQLIGAVPDSSSVVVTLPSGRTRTSYRRPEGLGTGLYKF
jgi:hypothetical protein